MKAAHKANQWKFIPFSAVFLLLILSPRAAGLEGAGGDGDDGPSIESVGGGSLSLNLTSLDAQVYLNRRQNASGIDTVSTTTLVTADELLDFVGNLTTTLQVEASRAQAAEERLMALLSQLNISTDTQFAETRAALSSSQATLADAIDTEVALLVANNTAALATEQSRAVLVEASLLTSINTEVSRATAVDLLLGAASSTAAITLGTEVSRATGIDNTLTATVLSEASLAVVVRTALNTSVLSETVRALAAEASLTIGISAEQSRAQLAETALSTTLNTAVSRSLSAEGSLAASVLAEQVRAAGAEGAISTALASEVTRAVAADAALSTAVSAEVVRAIGAENAVSTAVNTERVRAIAGELSVANSLASEITRATAAEASVQLSVWREISRAVGAENAISTAVETERVRALAGEASVQLSVWQETSRAVGAENAVSTAVNTERVRAIAGELSVANSLASEITRATAAEASVQLSVWREISRAVGAEGAISTSVETERVRALAAEGVVLAVAQGEISRALAAEASLGNRLVLGTAANPAVSCNEILQRSFGPSGVYWIRPVPASPVFQVFCDMETDGGGWTMVYKITAGTGVNPVNTWTSATPTNEGAVSALSIFASPLVGAYANRIISSYWNAGGFSLTAARVHIYAGGELKRALRFNAASSTNTNWFTLGTLVSSPWGDLVTGVANNFFSIVGDGGRQWFINRNYGSCGTDAGWMVLSTGTACGWETSAPNKPAIVYSPWGTNGVYQTSSNTLSFAQGEVFAVFVR